MKKHLDLARLADGFLCHPGNFSILGTLTVHFFRGESHSTTRTYGHGTPGNGTMSSPLHRRGRKGTSGMYEARQARGAQKARDQPLSPSSPAAVP